MNSKVIKRFWLAFVFLPATWAQIVPDRYIVELTGDPVAARVAPRGRRANQLEVAGHRANVQAEQLPTRLAIEQAGGQVLESVATVASAIMVRMRASDAAQLESLPGVKRVHPVREFKLLLDHAVVVHKIVDAWKLVGVEKAGAGMKIAMIDTGIDSGHPGFKDTSLAIPKGFPKTNSSSDKTFTNNKVIVARSYAPSFFSNDPDLSAQDDMGHGTATAMAAAGVLTSGPRATIRGVAPKAYLGSYKVFGSPGVNDTAPEDAILKAIDDAVADGMDVINLSLGDAVAVPLAQDLEAFAIQQATSMGVIVVVAAGNSGPNPHSLGSPASAPTAITVGASSNSRQFAASVTVGNESYVAIPGSNTPSSHKAIDAQVKDITTLGNDGLACSSFAPGSLQGKIALIFRGTCLFTDKLNHVQAGGAVGAIIYTDAARPDPIVMSAPGATLPASMVSNQDGVAIKQQLAAHSGLAGILDFTIAARSVDPDKLADFSAEGPNIDGSIKPDLAAVGTNVYTAAETSNPKGEVYDASGYTSVDGTSLSAPIVAGAAAVLKAARPGLSVAQYKSLLINTAAPAFSKPGVPAHVQQAGAGLLDMSAALRASGAASPASLSFGASRGTVEQPQRLTLTNVSKAPETFTIFVTGPVEPAASTQPVVTVSANQLTLNAGASADLTVTMTGFGLAAGAYEGWIHVLGTNSGVEQRVPYWFAVGPGIPAHITILTTASSPAAGTTVNDAAMFRVTDANGLTIPGMQPRVITLDGGGRALAVVSHNAFYPGVFGMNVKLGPTPGTNDFEIHAAGLRQKVTIVSQ